MSQILRVKRGPRPRIVKLPRDTWQGRTFIEADTLQELEVVWDGSAKDRPLCGRWPEGSPPHQRTVGHPVVRW